MKNLLLVSVIVAATGLVSSPSVSVAEKTSPQPLDIVRPEYPEDLKAQMVEGEAVVTLTINEEGVPEDCVLKEASHEAFGEAAMAAVKQWRFKPATEDGEAVSVRVNLPVRFNMSPEERINAMFRRRVYKGIDPDVAVLDGKRLPDGKQPVPVVSRYPRYPEKLKGSGKDGEVTVRFVIDTDGKPINPEFTAVSDNAFITPVLAAVATSEYEPYLHGGEPAYVIMELNYLIKEQPETLGDDSDS